MKRTLFTSALPLLAASLAMGQAPSAADLMAKAQAEAKATHKNIFVKFDASW